MTIIYKSNKVPVVPPDSAFCGMPDAACPCWTSWLCARGLVARARNWHWGVAILQNDLEAIVSLETSKRWFLKLKNENCQTKSIVNHAGPTCHHSMPCQRSLATAKCHPESKQLEHIYISKGLCINYMCMDIPQDEVPFCGSKKVT